MLIGIPDVVQWLVGLSLILTALVAIGVAVKNMWGFLRKFINTVDIIGKLDKSLTDIKATIASNGETMEANGDKLDKYAEKLDVHLTDANTKFGMLTGLQEQMKDVVYELKPNGGNSLADKVNALTKSGVIAQHGIDGLYAQPGEPGAPGRSTGTHNPDEG